MRRMAGWLSGGSLLVIALLGSAGAVAASPDSAQADSAGQANLALPALPDAPVVVAPPAEDATKPSADGSKPSADASKTTAEAPKPASQNEAEQPAAASAPDAAAPIQQADAPATLQSTPAPDASAPEPLASQPTPLPDAANPIAAPPALQTAINAFLQNDHRGGRAEAENARRRQAIAAFYAARAYAPLWQANNDWTAGARAAVTRLRQADDDGLDAARFDIPDLRPGDEAARDIEELALSESVVLYGEEASGGSVNPRTVSALIADSHTRLEPTDILNKISASSDPAQTLEDFNPPQPGYRALRAALVKLRDEHHNVSAFRVPPGRTLRAGMRDARVPLIRARFGLGLDAASNDQVYDAKVAAAVADFQRTAGIDPSGVLTPRTLAALSGGGAASMESDLIANMEMWRWTPRDLGANHIEVNIPDFTLALYRGEEVVRRARVVVGKAATPTPLFSNAVRFVVVNPSWEVPQSIIQKEMLPKLAADPNYLQDLGYVVTRKGDHLDVRQPPGDKNALGRIKFLFPNDYAVYLHDTPEKALFSASKRAFSHGCVRVQDPFALGQDVLGLNHGWSEARLKKMIGPEERTIRMPTPLPIHIEYFTAFVDASGRLQRREDVYGYMRKVKTALGLVG